VKITGNRDFIKFSQSRHKIFKRGGISLLYKFTPSESMKTLIDLPKPIFQQARRFAADQGVSLSELIAMLLAKNDCSNTCYQKPSERKPMKSTESSDWRDELL